MGGSGIAGDVFNVVNNAQMPVPVTVLKQYRTPGYVGPGTLAFALSYSGNTEETLSMAQGAVEAGATLVTVSSGGELANFRRALHVECAPGYMPRSALGSLVAPLFVSLFRMGVLPEAHALLVKAQEQLAHRRDRCRPEVTGAANPARRARAPDRPDDPADLRRWCDRRGRGDALEVRREREREGPGVLGRSTRRSTTTRSAGGASTATSPGRSSRSSSCGTARSTTRLAPRFAATRALIEECVAQVLEVQAEGEGRLAQLLDLMYVGDWTSCYLALQNDVDPGPIDAITHLKQALA